MWTEYDEGDSTTHLPVGVLLLVCMEGNQICLRRIDEDGDLYDENEYYDDSGLAVWYWMEIPAIDNGGE